MAREAGEGKGRVEQRAVGQDYIDACLVAVSGAVTFHV